MRLVSHVGRAIRKAGFNTTEFARESGIARSTLEKLIGNHFSEIRRDTIERLAERLQISDLTELFSLHEDQSDFLSPFVDRKSVTFVFGTHDVTDSARTRSSPVDEATMRTTVDLWDFRTQTELLSWLRRHVPEIRDELLFFSKQSFGEAERQQVLELVRMHNTVIVGSPKVNPACEAVLSALYRGSQGTRRGQGPMLKLSDDARMRGSILGAEGYAEQGVVDTQRGEIVVPFQAAGTGERSQDAGILFTVFRPLGTAEEVSLVIAAGMSGCATYGSIRSLIDEPPRADELTPGVPSERAVRTTYRKPSATRRDDREVVEVTAVRGEG